MLSLAPLLYVSFSKENTFTKKLEIIYSNQQHQLLTVVFSYFLLGNQNTSVKTVLVEKTPN